jgi:hypothetical protein
MTQEHESRLQEAGRKLVAREVVYCVSSLVYTLAQGYGHDATSAPDVSGLCEQAFELSSPLQDYEEAAEEEGWTRDGDVWTHPDREEAETSAENACQASGIEPHDREVYEHWIVSRWLADKLAAHGEKVDDDFAGMIVWARTTTGQAILLDGVIRDIVQELGWDKAEAA